MPSEPKQTELFAFLDEPSLKAGPAKEKRATSCPRCRDTYLSDRKVALRFDVSKATIWRWLKNNPNFPRPIKLSPGTSRWRLGDLVIFEQNMTSVSEPTAWAKTKGHAR